MNKITEFQEKDIMKIYYHLQTIIVLYAKKEEIDRNDVYEYIKNIIEYNTMGICDVYYPKLSEEDKKIYDYLLWAIKTNE